MADQYQLVMQAGPTPGKVFPLEGDVIIIGREAGNSVVIDDGEISRKHTQLVARAGNYIISDLGSTNGTFVNGERLIGESILKPGDLISLSEQINLSFEAVVKADPNATIIASARAPQKPAQAPEPEPTFEPEPEPATEPEPEPAPFAEPEPEPEPATMSQPAPAQVSEPDIHPKSVSVPEPLPANVNQPKKGNSRTITIIVAVIVLCLLCVCLGAAWRFIVPSLHLFGM